MTPVKAIKVGVGNYKNDPESINLEYFINITGIGRDLGPALLTFYGFYLRQNFDCELYPNGKNYYEKSYMEWAPRGPLNISTSLLRPSVLKIQKMLISVVYLLLWPLVYLLCLPIMFTYYVYLVYVYLVYLIYLVYVYVYLLCLPCLLIMFTYADLCRLPIMAPCCIIKSDLSFLCIIYFTVFSNKHIGKWLWLSW